MPRVAQFALTLVALATFLAAGCNSSSTSSTSGSSDQLRIAVIPKGTSHEFWKSVHFGAQKAAEETGQRRESSGDGPVESKSDTGSQIDVVKNMITMQCRWDRSWPPIRRADWLTRSKNRSPKGIPVVIFRQWFGRRAPKLSATSPRTTTKAVKWLPRQMAKAIERERQRDLAPIHCRQRKYRTTRTRFSWTESKNVPQHQSRFVRPARRRHTRRQVQREGRPVVAKLYGEDLAGIFAVCEPNANGTLEALRNAGLNQKVKLIAFDPSDALIEALGDGSCSGIVLQDPVQMGYQSVKTMVDAINGESRPKDVHVDRRVRRDARQHERRAIPECCSSRKSWMSNRTDDRACPYLPECFRPSDAFPPEMTNVHGHWPSVTRFLKMEGSASDSVRRGRCKTFRLSVHAWRRSACADRREWRRQEHAAENAQRRASGRQRFRCRSTASAVSAPRDRTTRGITASR